MALEVFLASTTGIVLASLARRMTAGVLETDRTGASVLSVAVEMPRAADQFRFYDREGALRMVVTDGGVPIWRGRLESVRVGPGVLNLMAHGHWRAYNDLTYTALWSDTSVAEWVRDVVAGVPQDRYNGDNQNRLYLSLKENASYATGADGALWRYQQPHKSARQVLNVAFDYSVTLPNNWRARMYGANEGYASVVLEWNMATTGAAQTGAQCIVLSAAKDFAYFYILNETGGAYTSVLDDGSWFAQWTNVRITTQALAVDTTLSANALAAATSISVTSATNIVIGMSLYLGGTNPERVTVTNVSGTTITITALANAKSSTNTVRAQRVLASDIAAHLADVTNATNPLEVRDTAGGITITTRDYLDVTHEDARPSAILADLAQTEELRAVVRDRTLYMEAQSVDLTQYWTIDVDAIEAERALDAVRNRVYARYKDASGRTLRDTETLATSNDLTSQSRWGVVRSAEQDVDTTSLTLARALASVALTDSADPAPKVQIPVVELRTPFGQRVGKWRAVAGDVVSVPSLSRSLTTDVENVATMRLAQTSYDLVTDELTIEAETPPDSLVVLLAQRAAGGA